MRDNSEPEGFDREGYPYGLHRGGATITSAIVWGIRHGLEVPRESVQERIDYLLHKMAKVGATKSEVEFCLALFGIDDQGIDVKAALDDWNDRLLRYGHTD